MRYPTSSAPGNLIQNVSVHVKGGKFASIIGPSGCGKTTLLRIAAGLERRFEGRILVGGDAINGPSRRMQMVFQDSRLLPWMTVADNVMFALAHNYASAEERVRSCLRSVGLAGKEDQLPKTLSGGERGRAALARALIDPPAILLLDEPFRNVDLRVRYDLLGGLQQTLIQTPRTVVLVSHSIEDSVLLSDTVYVFSSTPMTNPAVFEIPYPNRVDLTHLKSQNSLAE